MADVLSTILNGAVLVFSVTSMLAVGFSYTLREAVKDGWLADLKGYRVATDVDLSRVRVRRGDYDARQLQEAVNTDARNEAAFEHWAQVARDRRTIVFCTDGRLGFMVSPCRDTSILASG